MENDLSGLKQLRVPLSSWLGSNLRVSALSKDTSTCTQGEGALRWLILPSEPPHQWNITSLLSNDAMEYIGYINNCKRIGIHLNPI